MKPMSNKIIDGHFIVFDKKSDYEHYIGGDNGLSNGDCPNCKSRLELYLNIDTKDPVFRDIKYPEPFIRLVYCLNCSICWYPLQYIIKDNFVNFIECKCETQGRHTDEDECACELDKRDVSFKRTPDELQILCDKLNNNFTLTEEEELLFAKYANSYAPIEVGGYPNIDVFSQVGGRAFMSQRLKDPMCINCDNHGDVSKMKFLALLYKDEKSRFKIMKSEYCSSVHIVFFICPKCYAMQVQHSI